MRLIYRTYSGLYMYRLSEWSKLNLLYKTQWITFPSQSAYSCVPFVPFNIILHLSEFFTPTFFSIIIIIIIYSLEFFTSVLADGLSLEFEWQQVSSSLQDSS